MSTGTEVQQIFKKVQAAASVGAKGGHAVFDSAFQNLINGCLLSVKQSAEGFLRTKKDTDQKPAIGSTATSARDVQKGNEFNTIAGNLLDQATNSLSHEPQLQTSASQADSTAPASTATLTR